MTAPLSPSDRAEIEAVAKAATPGPWEDYGYERPPETRSRAGDTEEDDRE